MLKIAGTWMEKVNNQMHGLAAQVSSYEVKGHLMGAHGLTRKQMISRADNVWPDMWKHMFDASKHKAKQKYGIEKPKLDNARKLRGIFFIEPDDEEFKHTIKNAIRKLEIPMQAAMPCKTPIKSGGETHCGIVKHETQYVCIVDADESTRIRLEGVPNRYHEQNIAAKRINSLCHCILGVVERRYCYCKATRTRNLRRPSRMLARNWKHQWLPLCLAR